MHRDAEVRQRGDVLPDAEPRRGDRQTTGEGGDMQRPAAGHGWLRHFRPRQAMLRA
jgi:hypothetical protein